MAPHEDTDQPRRDRAAIPAEEAVEAVVRHRARAEAELTAATGGAALCRTELTHEAKRAEGALAAVAQVHRAVRRAPEVPPIEHARQAADEWTTALAPATTMGRTWLEYRTGGVTALAALIDDLGALAPSSTDR